MMRILLLGKNGQLGWEAQRTLAPLGDVICVDYPQVDFRDPSQLKDLVIRLAPDVVFNAAAYTAVDRAEQEKETAFLVNAEAPAALAEGARAAHAVMVHFSTDYVFDGNTNTAYTEEDAVCPLNVYGTSKLEGERRVMAAGGTSLVLRTSWLYSTRKESFVRKILAWAREQKTLKVVSDQVGSPTSARALAEASAFILAVVQVNGVDWLKERAGLYHLGGLGAASRYEWAKKILALDHNREEQVCTEIIPAESKDFQTPAQRPLFTALNCQKFVDTFGFTLPDWQTALELTLNELPVK